MRKNIVRYYHKLLERLDLQNLLTEKLHLDKSKPEHSCSPSQDGPCDWLWMETAELRIRHQVELKEAHKARGELAQNVIDLNKTLQLKETEIQDYQVRISRYKHEIAFLSKRCCELESQLRDLQACHEQLQDEHVVLQRTCSAVEERQQRTQQENSELVQRWMQEKTLEAERMNRCNETEERYRKLMGKLAKKLKQLKEVPVENEPSHRFSEVIKERTAADGESGNDTFCEEDLPDATQLLFESHEGEETKVRYLNQPALLVPREQNCSYFSGEGPKSDSSKHNREVTRGDRKKRAFDQNCTEYIPHS
ncbi:autophagy-related protein 16-1 isoform X2 [Latimeria chalumnae]|uniref:autophagy-related protein 16-1 isoform X2 n=1 Tax=Latimeria chalumnae TaxID=7897 RepID=UPI00313D9D48